MPAFSNDYYGLIFRATQSVELFCTYDKKLSIHERLEINKKIIQEKQGKDKPERGADRGVR